MKKPVHSDAQKQTEEQLCPLCLPDILTFKMTENDTMKLFLFKWFLILQCLLTASAVSLRLEIKDYIETFQFAFTTN